MNIFVAQLQSAGDLFPAHQADLENLVSIRIEAMRESLERVGRFDPVRARERFLQGFEPHFTCWIRVSGVNVGFVVVKHLQSDWLIDHLYVLPGAQGSGNPSHHTAKGI